MFSSAISVKFTRHVDTSHLTILMEAHTFPVTEVIRVQILTFFQNIYL